MLAYIYRRMSYDNHWIQCTGSDSAVHNHSQYNLCQIFRSSQSCDRFSHHKPQNTMHHLDKLKTSEILFPWDFSVHVWRNTATVLGFHPLPSGPAKLVIDTGIFCETSCNCPVAKASNSRLFVMQLASVRLLIWIIEFPSLSILPAGKHRDW